MSNTKKNAERKNADKRSVTGIALTHEAYQGLCALADDNMRTPNGQATWMLEQAGRERAAAFGEREPDSPATPGTH